MCPCVGRHCCLWCEIATENLKVPLKERGFSAVRTLQSLKSDYTKFQQAGAILKNAKLFNNVIHENLWDIPIGQVDSKSYTYI